MNFDRSLILSYLEEDNIQRAYFRVRPLLTLDGDIRQEAVQLWPNEGGLRIVPDRNEQHTFKARMRTLGSYCVVDLRNQPAEAGKIRTNKNFRPERGEVNQYILYSDTVHGLPEHTFYHLLDGEVANFAELAKDAITPLFYIRQEDTLYGPVRKDAPAQPETAREMAAMLFDLPCPDGVSRALLCIEEEQPAPKPVEEETPAASEQDAAPAEEVKPETPVQEAAPVEAVSEPEAAPEKAVEPEAVQPAPAAPETLPIGEELHILDENKNHEETLEQLNKPVSKGANLLRQQTASAPVAPAHRSSEPLSGTPLVRTPLHVSAQQTKNRTQEIVNNQWAVGKYEPPAQNLPNGTTMRSVSNPVEAACSALREAWKTTASHDQLADFMLSLEGLRAKLETKMCNGESVTVMQRILRQRLQDLEAERLVALCELDRARKDVDAYKQELLTGMANRITRETGKLEADRKSAAQQLDALKAELNALTLQRDALLAKVDELQSQTLPEAVAKLTADALMAAPVSGIPLRMSPVSGEDVGLEELIARVLEACAASGVKADRNTAIALLALMAISPRIGVSCQTTTSLSTLVGNMMAFFGWSQGYAHQYAAEQHPLAGMRLVDSTPAVLATNLPNYAPIAGVTKLTLSRNTSNLVKNAAYDVNPWPILALPALPFVPELDGADAKPVSAASIAKLAEMNAVSDAELDAVLAPVLNMASPLSGAARKDLYRFVSVCAGLMEGGLPVAADWGILLWITPNTKGTPAFKTLLDEYPLSLNSL